MTSSPRNLLDAGASLVIHDVSCRPSDGTSTSRRKWTSWTRCTPTRGRACCTMPAGWRTHEYPYLDKPDQLEYPTETWAAQDMRKSDIFKFAAKHARDADRERFLERSDFFFRSSIGELMSTTTRSLTRPVVLMMTSGYMHCLFSAPPRGVDATPRTAITFDPRQPFVSQRDRALRKSRLFAAAHSWWRCGSPTG